MPPYLVSDPKRPSISNQLPTFARFLQYTHPRYSNLSPLSLLCELEDDDADADQHQESSGRRLSSIPHARTYLAFFSQVALVREENVVGVDDLSHTFGARIFGGGSSSLLSSTSGNVARSGMDETVFNAAQRRGLRVVPCR